jgi:hypothetical protein
VTTGAGASTATGDGQHVLGLLADPGMPATLVRRLVDGGELPALLDSRAADGGGWRVETATRPLSLDADGNIPTVDIGRAEAGTRGWDVVVLVTDLPRRAGTDPILADYSGAQRVGLLSVPALGAIRLRRRAQEAVVYLVAEYLHPPPARRRTEQDAGDEADGADGSDGSDRGTQDAAAEPRTVTAPLQHVDSPDAGLDQHLALRGFRGRTRLLAGMVRANRPWLLVPSLSPAIAGAAAGAAFGVFYSNIWTLADAFTPARLALVGALAVVAMIVWLIGDNGLWERPSNRRLREEAVLFNVATVVTMFVAVVYVYVLLCLATLGAAYVVIPEGFMSSTLGHPVDAGDYAGLALLAASMGIIAGALGSGLAGEETVRRAAYSKREEERRRRIEEESAEETSETSG